MFYDILWNMKWGISGVFTCLAWKVLYGLVLFFKINFINTHQRQLALQNGTVCNNICRCLYFSLCKFAAISKIMQHNNCIRDKSSYNDAGQKKVQNISLHKIDFIIVYFLILWYKEKTLIHVNYFFWNLFHLFFF